MHQLFSLVLGQRDLSRAGDLFSLEDVDIEDCLSQALDQIKSISCSADYLTSDNDQAVVEICITRITTAIRETGSIERHSAALVALWESCLEHNLTPQEESTEDTPHAKIASDITSCILQNYSCPSVMALAVPVAVRFLHRGNKELSRNMSSYLSLAAIAKADLLSEHAEAIALSVLGGNHMLLRVLPSIYPRQPDKIHHHLGNLTAMMPRLEPAEQQHLLRLIQMVAEQHPLMLSPHVPALVSFLTDRSLTEALLGTLVDVSQASPSSLVSFLPTLRVMAHQCPTFLGHISKIYGAVGILNEFQAHNSLLFLVSLLSGLEHTFHHTVLQEIRALSERFPLLLGGCGKDIYRMSNSFTAMARLLGKRLEDSTALHSRLNKEGKPSPWGPSPGPGHRLELSVQGFGEKVGAEVGEEGDTLGPQRRYSLSHTREERREMRFNRSKSLALHVVRSRSISSDTGEDGTDPELHLDPPPHSPPSAEVTGRDTCAVVTGQSRDTEAQKDEPEKDRLFVHLRDNMDPIREFCQETMKKIPVPEECVIEDSNRGCVAKLSFSCALKGHYCLYAKSSFSLTSRQPHQWIHVMLLQLQSKSNVPLCSQHECVQTLAALWEKTKLRGAMTQHSTLHGKDLDSLQTQLEEVRFFDLFGFSEEHRGWLCFMCNNPEKATGVNQDGQPLIEGKLKEKQIRWRFIKRWKTRYFTLAGNQLLFRKGGKSKDEMDDIPIELSKVQSVKVVARKRRDRGLPRAFEIFTDSKTYVLKAQDQKHAEEWLQCINVAVVQARERESREATTYL
ncbi:ventricular zone-expressed PH domain-containing protein [Eucyclogobius newberryi]|uniref:ventricular zone-expressed PH domain-containing protein n=1 Tax=Eucyclogobius newberryi TaxID=166745 RepID=UPI003B5BA688